MLKDLYISQYDINYDITIELEKSWITFNLDIYMS